MRTGDVRTIRALPNAPRVSIPHVDGGQRDATGGPIDRPPRAGHAQGPVGRRFKIVICRGPECGDRRGSAELHAAFCAALDTHGAREHTEVAWQSCFGRCTQGPNVLVREILTGEPPPLLGSGFATLPGPRGATALYNRVDSQRAAHLVAKHVMEGQIVREYVERPGLHPSDPSAMRTKDT
jgi:(2Fe-2S) ferredoxin